MNHAFEFLSPQLWNRSKFKCLLCDAECHGLITGRQNVASRVISNLNVVLKRCFQQLKRLCMQLITQNNVAAVKEEITAAQRGAME